MLGRTYETQVCSISRALEVFGERWTLLILRNALFADATRFADHQRALGIATNVLATRLDRLVEADVLRREGDRYLLTARGRDIATALVALTEWGDRWAAPHGSPVLYRHDAGEHAVHVELVCEQCGPLDAEAIAEVEALPGPGMPEPQATRVRDRHRARHHVTI
jgi:DNA-binding HxlR family transcriptional regulator